MKNSTEFIFGLSLFTTLFMGGVSFLLYQKNRNSSLLHLLELWGSLLVLSVSTFAFDRSITPAAAFSMVGWIWVIRSITLMMEDLTERELLARWHVIALCLGGVSSFALAGYGYSFLYSSIPFSVATGIAGLHLCQKVFLVRKDILARVTTFVFGLFFTICLTFPLWRGYPESIDAGLFSQLFFIIALTGVSLSAIIQEHSDRHDLKIESLLKERSEKFLGQSKFSELGMMSAGIAHEINNPLAVIQARTTQLLRIYRNPDRQKELADGLQQILFTSERINKTIQGVREFVHHDENGPVQEIELKDVVDDVLAFTGQRMKNHGVNLRFYGLEKYTVVGNKVQLEQIILNLLNNSFDAIEFLPDKWIEVSCNEKGGRVQLFFKDSGNGIPKEISSRMMEPFFSTKDIGKGTGLGLALAQGIAEKHGGSLQYMENCPHTTFKLELPKTKDDWNVAIH